jgi:DNA-binding NtrC family response regulator
MAMSTQQKLLRVLEERTFTRVGGVRLISVDVRIIAATNRTLEEDVHEGKFREDLFYRLAVVPITLPALAERKSDVPILARHYLQKFCREVGKPSMDLSVEAMKLLSAYGWPGNVRELRNLMERVVVLCDKPQIDAEDLPGNLRGAEISQEASTLVDQDLPLAEILHQVEKRCILRAMERAKGKKIEVARLLQISRPTLDKKLKEYGLAAE